MARPSDPSSRRTAEGSVIAPTTRWRPPQRAIFGFLPPPGEHVLLDGVGITGTPPHRMVERGVVYGPQQPRIFAEMTVEENITIGAWTSRRDGGRIRRKLDENYARFPSSATAGEARRGNCPADCAGWWSSPGY